MSNDIAERQSKAEIDHLRVENKRLKERIHDAIRFQENNAGKIDRLLAEIAAILQIIEDRAETFHTECRRQAARDILNAVRYLEGRRK